MGLSSIENTKAKEFPKVKHQLCLIHIKRNILEIFPRIKRLEIAEELLQVFAIDSKAVTPVEGFENLCKLVEKHKKSYTSLKSFLNQRNTAYFTC
ncbi:transposase [Flavobacterium sp. PL002]|uniref:transposase n=1 Tax=Flavobacterium sp. PL002 TaxID=1897058 RepID=UPI001CE3F1BA